MQLRLFGLAAAALFAAAALSGPAKAILVIDDFEEGGTVHSTGPISDPTPGSVASDFNFPLAPGQPDNFVVDTDDDVTVENDDEVVTLNAEDGIAAGVIGGSRDTSGFVQEVYGSGSINGIDVGVDFNQNGLYQFSQATGHYGHGWIQWDGNGDPAWDLDPNDYAGDGTQKQDFAFGPGDNDAIYHHNVQNGLGGVDITEGGVNNALEVDVNFTDLENVALLFRFYDEADFREDRYVSLATLIPDPIAMTTVTLLFSDAALYDGGLVPGGDVFPILQNTGAIVFHTHTLDEMFNHAALDLDIGEIRATQVPVPASLALLGIGLFGLGTLARHRRIA